MQIHQSLGGVNAQAGAWRLHHRWSGCRGTSQHLGRTSARKCPASLCSSVGGAPTQTACSTMTCPAIPSQSLRCVLQQSIFKAVASLLLQVTSFTLLFSSGWHGCPAASVRQTPLSNVICDTPCIVPLQCLLLRSPVACMPSFCGSCQYVRSDQQVVG